MSQYRPRIQSRQEVMDRALSRIAGIRNRARELRRNMTNYLKRIRLWDAEYMLRDSSEYYEAVTTLYYAMDIKARLLTEVDHEGEAITWERRIEAVEATVERAKCEVLDWSPLGSCDGRNVRTEDVFKHKGRIRFLQLFEHLASRMRDACETDEEAAEKRGEQPAGDVTARGTKTDCQKFIDGFLAVNRLQHTYEPKPHRSTRNQITVTGLNVARRKAVITAAKNTGLTV